MKIKTISFYSLTQHVGRYKQLLTIQNAGLLVAVIISMSWVWGAVVTLQKNYKYQRQVDANTQLIELTKLQNKTFQYQQAYYKSGEYLELSARAKLNAALPGEHLVILPSSNDIKDSVPVPTATTVVESESNFGRWLDFFFQAH